MGMERVVPIRIDEVGVPRDAAGALRLDRPVDHRYGLAGAATLIMAISACAALFVVLSILSAVFSTISHACSEMRARAG
jgi:hypothetical protein